MLQEARKVVALHVGGPYTKKLRRTPLRVLLWLAVATFLGDVDWHILDSRGYPSRGHCGHPGSKVQVKNPPVVKVLKTYRDADGHPHPW